MLGRKSKRIGPNADRFAKRQRESRHPHPRAGSLQVTAANFTCGDAGSKLWLETHVWHAKRMHMMEIWGHRLVSPPSSAPPPPRRHRAADPVSIHMQAHRPTAKAFRASYRASLHGALVHDASYFQYLELTGPEEELVLLLAKMSDVTMPSPGGKRCVCCGRSSHVEDADWTLIALCRYLSGQRECDTVLHSVAAVGSAAAATMIGPATIIWDTPSTQPSTSTVTLDRKVLLRLHPAICASVWDAVQAAKTALWPKGNLTCMPHRMDKGLLTFEVTGRRATEVVKSVLRPVIGTDKETKEAWRKLSGEKGPGSVPRGMVLGLNVYDPRLL